MSHYQSTSMLADYNKRLETFDVWPIKTYQKCKEFALNGLFLNGRCKVVCVYCHDSYRVRDVEKDINRVYFKLKHHESCPKRQRTVTEAQDLPNLLAKQCVISETDTDANDQLIYEVVTEKKGNPLSRFFKGAFGGKKKSNKKYYLKTTRQRQSFRRRSSRRKARPRRVEESRAPEQPSSSTVHELESTEPKQTWQTPQSTPVADRSQEKAKSARVETDIDSGIQSKEQETFDETEETSDETEELTKTVLNINNSSIENLTLQIKEQ